MPENKQPEELEIRKRDFFQFYSVKASAYFSMGSHDEWNIWQELNEKRALHDNFGMGSQIPGYFETLQISPGAAESRISPGYAVGHPEAGIPSKPPVVVLQTATLTPAVSELEKHQ